jgi:hypothetical protein
MNLKKHFGSNPKKETQGTWVDVAEGVKILVARINNPRYTMRLMELQRPNWKQYRRGNVDLVKEAEMHTRVIAETILLGWVGLTDDKGEPVEYSVDKAIEILSDPELHDFRDFVVEESQRMSNFRDIELEEAAKN